MDFIEQVREFFKPFPKPGSWAYKFQIWLYDRQTGKPADGSFSIDPSEEAVDNGENTENNILDSDPDCGSDGDADLNTADDRSDNDGDAGGELSGPGPG